MKTTGPRGEVPEPIVVAVAQALVRSRIQRSALRRPPTKRV
ncbi:hypothetical protein HNP40_001267 [Mycobacteroides chelonae]|nr:hypothetical protein [Mycobacteroides chelonae]